MIENKEIVEAVCQSNGLLFEGQIKLKKKVQPEIIPDTQPETQQESLGGLNL